MIHEVPKKKFTFKKINSRKRLLEIPDDENVKVTDKFQETASQVITTKSYNSDGGRDLVSIILSNDKLSFNGAHGSKMDKSPSSKEE